MEQETGFPINWGQDGLEFAGGLAINQLPQNPLTNLSGTSAEFPQYESPFGSNSLFNQSDWKQRLERLLLEHNISEFIYSNMGFPDSIPLRVRIRGRIINGQINLEISSYTPNPWYPSFNKGIDYTVAYEELKNHINNPRFLAFKKNDKWQVCDRYIDQKLVSQRILGMIDLGYFEDNDYKQIYYEFTDCLNAKINELKKKFQQFCTDLEKQLKKGFYSDVNITANVSLKNQSGKTIAEKKLKSNENKKSDVDLDITLHSDGRVEIKKKFSPAFLKEYEDRWQKEAKSRGLNVNVEEMRKDITDFLNSEKAGLTFGDKVLREVRTWYDESVGGFIEGIQATTKVIKHVWREGTINESLWHSTDKEHQNWPKYMQFDPYVGGISDGIIDEVTGLPMACKSIYQFATSSKKRKEFAKVFTAEGFKQMYEGLKQEALEIANDGEKLKHFSGKTTVSVVSMLTGVGLISKVGKADEFLEVAQAVAKKVDDIPDPKFHQINDLLKKSKRTVADEKLLKELIDEVGEDYLRDYASELLDLAKLAVTKKKIFSWPEVKAFFKRGNDYNKKVQEKVPPKYDFHEVTIEVSLKDGKVKKYRLDSYNEGVEIVSRKATDFNNIQLETFEGYLKELKAKYPEGAKITAPKYGSRLENKVLKGQLKLEVPLSNKASSKVKEFTELAKNKYGIELVFEPE
jgi:hypothetical protein